MSPGEQTDASMTLKSIWEDVEKIILKSEKKTGPGQEGERMESREEKRGTANKDCKTLRAQFARPNLHGAERAS